MTASPPFFLSQRDYEKFNRHKVIRVGKYWVKQVSPGFVHFTMDKPKLRFWKRRWKPISLARAGHKDYILWTLYYDDDPHLRGDDCMGTDSYSLEIWAKEMATWHRSGLAQKTLTTTHHSKGSGSASHT